MYTNHWTTEINFVICLANNILCTEFENKISENCNTKFVIWELGNCENLT